MTDKLYLVKEGEISLKGGNRNLFEKRLRHNIKDKLRPYHSEINKQKGRLYAYIDEAAPDAMIEKALSTTSGITGFAKAHRAEKDMDAIVRCAASILPGAWIASAYLLGNTAVDLITLLLCVAAIGLGSIIGARVVSRMSGG